MMETQIIGPYDGNFIVPLDDYPKLPSVKDRYLLFHPEHMLIRSYRGIPFFDGAAVMFSAGEKVFKIATKWEEKKFTPNCRYTPENSS